MLLIFVSLAPVLALIMLIYFKDKYEKEPFKTLLWAFFLGMLIVIPVVIIEQLLSNYFTKKFDVPDGNLSSAAYNAFIVASFTEEAFKMLVFMIFIWRNKNFNEKFDGIVYAALISLGFAAVENVLYVFQNGMPTGILRAFTAVPGHAIFGITMGFFLGLAKFDKVKRGIYLMSAFMAPFFLHGVYDFILMSQQTILLLLFIPYLIFMFIFAWKRMKTHSENSVFKQQNSEDLTGENQNAV
jgi:RsiW-degrading membrane proteinase PrsW (M82 family)